MNRNFKGVWIPAEIWLSEDLSLVDKALLAEIDSFSTNEKPCFASNEHFAKFLNVGTATVTRSLKKLESLGYISVKTKKERDQKGRITTTRLIKMINGTANQNDHSTANQNDEYTNTVFTNTNTLSNSEERSLVNLARQLNNPSEKTEITEDWKPSKECIAKLKFSGVPKSISEDPDVINKFIWHYQSMGTLCADWEALYKKWCIREKGNKKSISYNGKKIDDSIPFGEIIDLYNEVLSDELPECIGVTDERKEKIAEIWDCDDRHKNINFWTWYFNQVKSSEFLTGKKNGFRANIDFLINKNNLYKVIEGAYQ